MHHPLRGLTRRTLARELLAGVTLLAISVPLNIGYAQIAGLSPTAGLYALVVPTIVYALTVSSRQVVASPDAAAAALVFSSLAGLGVAGENFAVMAAAQAVLSGLMLLAASFFKLGFLANFLSRPILVGFVGGLALEIMVSQVAKMLGIRLESGAEFIEKAVGLATGIPGLNPWSAGMSVACLAVLLVGRRLLPVVPWALVVLVFATLATVWLDLESRGVAVLGEVPAGPPVFAVPLLDLRAWLALIPSALALTLVAMAEGLLVSRSYAEKRGYDTNPNQDLFAFGLANLASGVSSSFAIGSSTSRTAAMDQSGSRTQLPSLVLAVGSLLLLLFGTELLAAVPSPAIGAVVAVAVVRLIGVGEFRELLLWSRFEFAVGVACFLGVLVLGPIGGLLLAFVLSLINLARRAAAPSIELLAPGSGAQAGFVEAPAGTLESAPGVIVLRFAAPIFFANGTILADRVKADVAAAPPGLHSVVLDMGAVSDVDVTGADAVRGLRERLERGGIRLAYSRVRPSLRARLQHFELLAGASEYATNREAVAAALARDAN